MSDIVGDLLRCKLEVAKLKFDLHKAEGREMKQRDRTSSAWIRLDEEQDRFWQEKQDLLAQIKKLKEEHVALCTILNHPDFTAIRDKALLEVGFNIKQEALRAERSYSGSYGGEELPK